MAGRGPAPKDPAKRVRRNVEKRETLPAKPVAGHRAMPPGEWSPATVRWWLTWCESAQSSKFTEPAWQRLEMLVPLVSRYWAIGDANALKEIRLNESLLGATPVDLQRLKWDLAPADEPPAARTSDELATWRRKRRVVDGAASAT